MSADSKKPIEVQDCIGPRPEYFFSADRGHLFGMTFTMPGPFPSAVWKVFSQRHRDGVLLFEMLQLATFGMN